MFLKGYSINSNIFNIGTRFSHLFKTAESVQWYDCIFFVSDSQIQSTNTFYLYRKMPGPAIYQIFNTFMAHNCTQRPEIVAC